MTGTRFTEESAQLGNDLATLPDFPAEIRAPAGTLAGVSSFQIHFGSCEIYTPGDSVDVLVAFNPAALKANLSSLKPNGILICNSDAFTERNLKRVGYESNPLEGDELKTSFTLVPVPVTKLTREALSEVDLPSSGVDKCKNFFALGIVSWLYGRSMEQTLNWIEQKFASKNPVLVEANRAALEGGMAFAQASEIFPSSYEVGPAKLEPGTYRNITGNLAVAYGLVAAGEKMGKPIMFAGYPITPASDILHELSRHKDFGVITFQAEDEIAACCAAIGASYSGRLGVTASSGPGIALKQEAIGLAVSTELPLVIVNVQRAGPSTGLPTKTEQADLLEVLYGRNGECPCVVIAIASPSEAFEITYEACRIAVEHMIPVFLLSDGYIANGAEPWNVPDVSSLPPINMKFAEAGSDYLPYARSKDTLVREWAMPGTPGLEHRIGGLEKEDGSGNVSYDPENHERMCLLRAERVQKIADSLPPTVVDGPEFGDVLVVSWGGTLASVSAGVHQAQGDGVSVSHLHLRYLNPLPKDLAKVLGRFKSVIVPEINLGQLSQLLRSKYLVDAQGVNKIQGQPFKVSEIREAIDTATRKLKEVA